MQKQDLFSRSKFSGVKSQVIYAIRTTFVHLYDNGTTIMSVPMLSRIIIRFGLVSVVLKTTNIYNLII